MKRRAVFLDRDGVLVRPTIRDGYAYGPITLAELELLPGVAEPVRRLREAGYLAILATNQPGIARGVLDWPTLNEIHTRLKEAVPLDDIRVCPHTDADGCACRKPRPGMIVDAAARFDLDLGASYFIGDTDRDVEAALAAGVTPVLLDTYYNQGVGKALRVAGLSDAADWILSRRGTL